jgi:hypothetical protein
MTRLVPLAVILAVAAPAAAFAGKIDDRREWQAERIEQGRDDGSITWTEGIKLRAEQRRIARKEAELKSDGYLSAADRKVINDMQNDATRSIKKEENDGWHRLFGLPRVGK